MPLSGAYNLSALCRKTAVAILTVLVSFGMLSTDPPAAQARDRYAPMELGPEKRPIVRLYVEPVLFAMGSSATDEQDVEIDENTKVTVHESETDFSHTGLGIDPLTIGIGADFLIANSFFIGPYIAYGSTTGETTDGTDGREDKGEHSTYNLMLQAGGIFSLGGDSVKASIRGGVGYYGRTDNSKSYSTSGTLQVDDVYEESALSWTAAAIIHFMVVEQASLDLGVRYMNIAAHDIDVDWKQDDTKFSHETDAMGFFSVIAGLSVFL